MSVNSFSSFFQSNKFLITILLFSALTKLALIWPDVIPFSFDHGKDSLAILYMIETLSPKLIGPWTSIPGLYFGPGWYYLLAPGYILMGGNPISGVIVMIGLNLLTIYLAFRYFGWLEALMFATSAAFINLSTSAWNPFPMPLLMLIILINLRKKYVTILNLSVIALAVSFSFHFSSAYAIFYLVMIPLVLLVKYRKQLSLFPVTHVDHIDLATKEKTKLTSQSLSNRFQTILHSRRLSLVYLLIPLAAFVIPFTPQIVFELRHDFVQTNGVIQYLQNPPDNQPKTPIMGVVAVTWGELLSAFSPSFSFGSFGSLLLLLTLLLIAWGGYRLVRAGKPIRFLLETVVFVGIPVIGFSFLHFNVWYTYAMLSLVVVFVAQFIRQLSKEVLVVFVILLLVGPISKVIYSYQFERPVLSQMRTFLPVKLEAIELIREKADGQPFASYHYVPDIYDFSYQYLYISQAMDGQPLPVEFSYLKDVTPYILEKEELIAGLPVMEGDPEHIFFIVEKPENDAFLNAWWQQQRYGEIIDEIPLSDTVTVYQATPEN